MQITTQEHGLSVQRACSSARLSRAAYYRPVQDRSAADAKIIAALNELVAVELRWGLWKCYDRLRQMGNRWNHKRAYREETGQCGDGCGIQPARRDQAYLRDAYREGL